MIFQIFVQIKTNKPAPYAISTTLNRSNRVFSSQRSLSGVGMPRSLQSWWVVLFGERSIYCFNGTYVITAFPWFYKTQFKTDLHIQVCLYHPYCITQCIIHFFDTMRSHVSPSNFLEENFVTFCFDEASATTAAFIIIHILPFACSLRLKLQCLLSYL